MLTITWSLAYIMCKQRIDDNKKCGESLAFSIAMGGCGGAMRGASPNGAYPGLHLNLKPLDATIS
jgi:hypothetical protein